MKVHISIGSDVDLLAIAKRIPAIYNDHVCLISERFWISCEILKRHKMSWPGITISASHRSKVVLLDCWHSRTDRCVYQECVLWIFSYEIFGQRYAGLKLWVCRLAAYGTKVNHHDIFQAVHHSFVKLFSVVCSLYILHCGQQPFRIFPYHCIPVQVPMACKMV